MYTNYFKTYYPEYLYYLMSIKMDTEILEILIFEYLKLKYLSRT